MITIYLGATVLLVEVFKSIQWSSDFSLLSLERRLRIMTIMPMTAASMTTAITTPIIKPILLLSLPSSRLVPSLPVAAVSLHLC